MIIWFYFALHLSFQYFTDGKLIVTLDANELNITKGQSANMTCSWNITDARRVRVEWRKYKLLTLDENGTLLSTGLWTSPNITNIFVLMNQNRSSYIITKDTAMMSLESITEEDEGLYVCKVVSEIPVLSSGQGNCTLTLIKDDSFLLWYLYFIILIIIPILITAYCCFRRWKKGKELHQDHTYGNMTRNTRKDLKHLSAISKKKKKKTKTVV